MKRGGHKDELVNEMKKLAVSHGIFNVFTNFLEISATCIAASMDEENAVERKRQYETITSRMAPEVLEAYARMLALLWLAAKENEDAPCDILGAIFHELKLNSEWKGQYFTPDYICRMMGIMMNPSAMVPGHPGASVIGDFSCGSGSMILGAVYAMKMSHCDYQRKCLFVAKDIDIRCVWMTYIQLTLYGIPAIVIHGNSLTDEEWSHWYTPYAPIPFMQSEDAQEMNKEKEINGNDDRIIHPSSGAGLYPRYESEEDKDSRLPCGVAEQHGFRVSP